MQLRCRTKSLDLTAPVVMGVVNVTPDSFSDGGKFLSRDAAIEHAHRLIEEGAGIIDIGGESTRPGSDPVPVDEELRRVIPVVEGLKNAPVVISVDTSRPEVMRAAAEAGAEIINDVRALRVPGALEAAVETGCAVCLMHMQGEPKTMQVAPTYTDVVNEVKEFLTERAQVCRAAGIADERILIDPGFGFGKNVEHNLALLRRLHELGPWPLLVGLSRKSLLVALLGPKPMDERVQGSVVLATLAVLKGARIVRVHDVAATVDAMKIITAVVEGRAGN